MAKATTPATEETTTASRSQMYKHEDFVAWATSEGLMDGTESPVEAIAVFAANRGKWRKTPRYRALRESGDPAANERKAERDAARAAKAEERAAAKEARAAERAAKAEAAAAAKAAAPAKAPAAKKTAAPATKAPAKATKAAKKGTAASDNPFG